MDIEADITQDTQEIEQVMIEPVEEVPSNVTVMGHPVHPMLITFPITFLNTTLIADLIALKTGKRIWSQIARYSLIAGIGSGVAAASTGTLDFLTNEPIRKRDVARFHMLANTITLSLAVLNLFSRRDKPNGPVQRSSVVLSLLTAGVLMIGGWLGGELVYRLKIGVDSTPRSSAQSLDQMGP